MPRILGVDCPDNKVAWVSLTRIFGIGRTLAYRVLAEAGINPQLRARELKEDDIARISTIIDKKYVFEGQLRRKIQQDLQRLKKISCYRGIRHARGLPVRGQRTRTNARTRKGKRKTVATKKSVKQLHS